MKIAHSTVAAAVLTVLLAGCTASGVASLDSIDARREKIEAAEARTRAERPLVEWVQVTPEQLREVTPERLKTEVTAFVVMRAERRLDSGPSAPSPPAVNLRDLLTGTVREVVIAKTGSEGDVGWGVAILPPGRYVVSKTGGVLRRTVVMPAGTAVRQVVETGPRPEVPLERSIVVSGGDVLYIGTTVGLAPGATGPVHTIKVEDNSTAAAKWMAANLPLLAPKLKTRLLAPVMPGG